MIHFLSGDVLSLPADICVNAVNCVGVMGCGVALAFKKRYPDMFESYRMACRKGLVKPGAPHVWERNFEDEHVVIINFPTKLDWRNPSRYEYIEKGLVWLHDFLIKHENKRVVIPALGCGHGGLDWGTVKQMILDELVGMNVDITVLDPV